MASINRYFKIRLKGTENFLTKNSTYEEHDFGNWAQARLFSLPGINIFLRHLLKEKISFINKDTVMKMNDLEVVEYNLIEVRGYDAEGFLYKNAKTPVLKL